MTNEKQEQLEPKIEKKENVLDLRELQELAQNTGKDLFVDNEDNLSDNNNPDTYFKTIIDKLFSKDDISTKTEYIDEDEQFCGTLLDFMQKKGGFGFTKTFINEWEVKRVSLKRKSRQEIVLSLWEREKEREQQEKMEFKQNVRM